MRKFNFSTCRLFVRAAFLGAIISVPTSCVNNDYDLDKEMDLTMNLIGSLTIPLGETAPVSLSDMLDPDEIEMLEEIDGEYKISMSDQISIDIDKIAGEDGVSVSAIEDDVQITTTLDTPVFPNFGLNIDPVSIPVELDIDEVSLGSATVLNEQIGVSVPSLTSISGVSNITITNQSFSVAMDSDSDIELNVASGIACPDEVLSVSSIEFGSTVDVSMDVSLFADLFTASTFELTVPELTIEFPKGFVLECEGNTSSEDNIVKLVNLTTTTDEISFEILVVKYDEPINKTAGKLDGITGDIACGLSNNFIISGTTSGATAGNSFELDIQSTIKASDMTLEVGNINVTIEEADNFGGATQIELPDLIKDVTRVTLDSNSNTINISIDPVLIPEGLTPSGDDIKILFPYPKFNMATDTTVQYESSASAYAVHIPVADIVGGAGFDKDVVINYIEFDNEIEVSTQEGVSNYIEFDPEITMSSTDVTMAGSVKLSAFNDFVKVDQNTQAAVSADNLEVASADIVSDDYEAVLSTASEPDTFDIKEAISIPDELVRIDKMLFADQVFMDLEVNVELTGTDSDLSFVNYTIEFPRFLTFADDVAVDSDNRMVLNDVFDVVSGGRQYVGSFEIVAIDFTDESYEDIISVNASGERVFSLDESVAMYGSVKMAAGDVDTGLLDPNIVANINFGINEMSISKVYGIVEPDLPSDSTTIDISELSETLDGDLSLVLTNPTITITATNPLAVPVAISTLEIIPTKDGTALETCEIVSAIEIPAADGDEPVVVEIYIYDESVDVVQESGVQYVAMSGLKNILEGMPDTIEMSYSAETIEIEGESHMIDLYADYSFTMDYDFSVPLTFDELTFEYTMTMEDLGDSLGSVADMVSSMEIDLEIENTMPLSLELYDIKALDEDGNELSGIVSITSSDGASAVIAASGTSTITAALSDNEAGDLSRFSGLEISISAEITSTEGGAELRADQYIVISMAARLPEGVTVDLNDLGGDDDDDDDDDDDEN